MYMYLVGLVDLKHLLVCLRRLVLIRMPDRVGERYIQGFTALLIKAARCGLGSVLSIHVRPGSQASFQCLIPRLFSSIFKHPDVV